MDKEDMVYKQWNITQPLKNDITSFATTWLDLEVIMTSGISQRQASYEITYMWDLKIDPNEIIYKAEIDSQT